MTTVVNNFCRKILHILLLYLLFTLSKSETWLKHNTYNYLFGSNKVGSFSEAESKCKKLDSNLVVIRSKGIQDFLLTRVKNFNDGDYYIGLKRKALNKDEFEWVDGTPYSGRYAYWADGEPNNHWGYDESCVLMWQGKGYMWNDAVCYHEARYICQRTIMTSTQAPSLVTPKSTIMYKTSFVYSSNFQANTGKNMNQTIDGKNLTQAQKNSPIYLIPALTVVLSLLAVTLIVIFICRKRKIALFHSTARNQAFVNETFQEARKAGNSKPSDAMQCNPTNSIYAVADDLKKDSDCLYTAVNKQKVQINNKTTPSQQSNHSTSAQYENIENNIYDNGVHKQDNIEVNLEYSQAVYNVLDKNR